MKNIKMEEIHLIKFYKKILEAYRNKQRFVVFRKPQDNILYLYINNSIGSFLTNYFFIGNFKNNHIIKIYPKKIFYTNISFLLINPLINKSFRIQYQKNIYNKYIKMIKKAISILHIGKLRKVVLSRRERIFFQRINLKISFQNLLFNFPESFVNLWYDSIHGLWIGATPELLFRIKNEKLEAIALAGTLQINDITTWSFKELEEHYMVIKYISNILKNYVEKFYINRTSTIVTGNIKHLQTSINALLKNKVNFKNLLYSLHPTPAICGFPQKLALDFILNNEWYDRTFYTGYIGYIENNNIEIYINIRCAKVFKKSFFLYTGSGITNNSQAKKEWLETEIKLQNILSQFYFF